MGNAFRIWFAMILAVNRSIPTFTVFPVKEAVRMMGGMIIISVLYPKTSESRFDYAYYMEKHMPLVKALWEPMGLAKAELMRGTVALGGSAPAYELIGNLTFGSVEQMQGALAAGAEVIRDIPNFTNVQPVVQICEPVSL